MSTQFNCQKHFYIKLFNEIIVYVKNLTKDGKYCSYLKWICSSKKKYYKNQEEYLEN